MYQKKDAFPLTCAIVHQYHVSQVQNGGHRVVNRHGLIVRELQLMESLLIQQNLIVTISSWA